MANKDWLDELDGRKASQEMDDTATGTLRTLYKSTICKEMGKRACLRIPSAHSLTHSQWVYHNLVKHARSNWSPQPEQRLLH